MEEDDMFDKFNARLSDIVNSRFSLDQFHKDNKDLDAMKKEDLVGEIQNYKIKFYKPKKERKSIGIVLSIVSEKSSRHASRTDSESNICEEDIA
ncbi:hypothetical protein L1049_019455 [Liquidambar formosana]|uniref:Uncharacterized protein n=1 Tax=Liquidambar formosana TaxID=63359 RepID=A0AAP0S6M1_LIQFO